MIRGNKALKVSIFGASIKKPFDTKQNRPNYIFNGWFYIKIKLKNWSPCRRRPGIVEYTKGGRDTSYPNHEET